MLEEKAVADVVGAGRVVAGLARLGETPVEIEPAAVGHVIDDLSIAASGIGRSQHEEIGFVLDFAGSVARGLVEVDDDAVTRVLRVELAAKDAFDALVAAGIAKAATGGEGLDRADLDASEPRERGS